ncbi:MAG: hypothetical protein Q8P18_30535 [Pseudomonadota bacterium]|nr:hypothetical protein [Pseudomonadota bacterium]
MEAIGKRREPRHPLPSPSKYALLLVALLVCGGFALTIGTADRFPGADGPHMLGQAMRLGGMLRAGELVEVGQEMFALSAPHPPFGYLPLVGLAALGLPLRGIIAGADLFWLLLILHGSVLLCSRKGEPDLQAGALATLAGVSAGLTWWSADHHGFDLPTAAVVLQSLGWLHASEGLTVRRASVCFGFWLACAFLTKYSAPLVLFLPVLVGCAPALWRQPRNLGLAALVWAGVAGIWLAANRRSVVDYVVSALDPPTAPGNFPEQLTLIQRFAGDGQGMFFAVLKDAMGWPVLALLLLGAVAARRKLPLLGLISGLLFLGAMNSREGRYALPLVILMAVAGAPAARWGWQPAVMLLAVLAPGLRGAFIAYRDTDASEAPARRPLDHPIATLRTLAPWPFPAPAFSPISEHPEPWACAEVLEEALPRLGEHRVLGMLLNTLPEAPSSSVYQLVAEQMGLKLDILTIHAMISPQGLMSNSYRGPLAVVEDAPPPSPGELRREPSGVTVVYVVTHPSSAAGTRWLAETPHTVLSRRSLPDGHSGVLVQKL